MWISKEEYNQLKSERDFYEQQLKDWEQEWKNAYKELKPIDGKKWYNDEIENLKERLCNTFRSYDNLKTKYDKMQVNLDAVKHDLFMYENEVSQVREALDHEAKRNKELFKLNNRLCDKLSELEKENNNFDAYFLESEIKQLIDLLDVALRDMNLHSNCTLYELEYDSKAHIYRIVTTPKTK
jgi:chromosome segregation ATPase